MRKIVTGLLLACLALNLSVWGQNDLLLQNTELAKDLKQEIAINFDKVQLTTIIKYISEQTGKNFLLDDTVRGTVTIISPTKISVAEALQVLTSILDAKGFSLVASGQIIKVVPKREARQAVIDTYIGSAPPQPQTADLVITQIYPLEFAKAEDVRNLLLPFMSKDSNLISYGPTNSLVVTDTASNIVRLIEMIKAVDVPTEELETRIIFVKFAEAKTMASILLNIFQSGQKTTTPNPHVRTGKPAAAGVASSSRELKIISDDRTNALIIIGDSGTLESVVAMIEELDKELPVGRDNIHVIYLKNSDAEELANVLNDIKTSKEQQDKSIPKPPTAHPSMALAAQSTRTLIVADKLTNALIITASPEDFATYQKVIDMLDIPRRQVYVEALIAEVRLGELDRLGIEWNTLTAPDEDEVAPFGVMNFGLTAEAMSGALLGATGGAYKGNKAGELPSIGAIINLYGNNQNFNILSTPHLVTTDNQEAEIIVGQTVPFLKSSRVTETETVVKTYDYEDVGITLRITPHVTDNEKVRLEIYQKITQVLDLGNLEAPTTTKREAKTAVTVANGKTVVIGGLVGNDKSLVVHKIPILGDIPLLKYLFSRTQWQDQKSNLLIFITPKVVNDAQDFQLISQQKEKARNDFIKEEAPKYLNETTDQTK